MGERIGTKTSNAESGTIEEFNIVYKKYLENPKSKKILFYFKNIKNPIFDTDLFEIQKVKDFMTKLGEEGVYYWKYSNFPEFRRYLHFIYSFVHSIIN